MSNTDSAVRYHRSPWVAGVLSLIMPGLGQVYSGALPRGLIWTFLCGAFAVAGLLFLAHPSPASWALGCAVELVQGVIWIAAAIDSYRLALRCKPDYEPKDYNRWYVYVLLLLLGTGGLVSFALHVREQLIQPFIIPTASMYPTILPHDRVIAVKNAYASADPQRGDLVLFTEPDNRRIHFIKRVVAVAGDTVEVKGGDLYINGAKLARDPAGPGTVNQGTNTVTGDVFYENNHGAKYRIFLSQGKPAADFLPVTIPQYECFVLGDNRNDSLDSRYFGPIPIATIQGKFYYRYWPMTIWSHVGTIK